MIPSVAELAWTLRGARCSRWPAPVAMLVVAVVGLATGAPVAAHPHRLVESAVAPLPGTAGPEAVESRDAPDERVTSLVLRPGDLQTTVRCADWRLS